MAIQYIDVKLTILAELMFKIFIDQRALFVAGSAVVVGICETFEREPLLFQSKGQPR